MASSSAVVLKGQVEINPDLQQQLDESYNTVNLQQSAKTPKMENSIKVKRLECNLEKVERKLEEKNCNIGKMALLLVIGEMNP